MSFFLLKGESRGVGMSDRTLIRHLASPELYDDGENSEFAVDSDSSYELKYRAAATNRVVVTTDHTQTLTNKTLTGANLSTDQDLTFEGDTADLTLSVEDQSVASTLGIPDYNGVTHGVVGAATVKFDATDGHDSAVGTSTGTVEIPAGAIILDIMVQTTVLWDAGTSTTMIVGDDDDDNGYFTGVNLQATDLVVGEVLSAMHENLWGGVNGVYLTTAGRRGRTTAGVDSGNYLGAATEVIGAVTTVGSVPSEGTTYMTVVWMAPTQTAATFAAT